MESLDRGMESLKSRRALESLQQFFESLKDSAPLFSSLLQAFLGKAEEEKVETEQMDQPEDSFSQKGYMPSQKPKAPYESSEKKPEKIGVHHNQISILGDSTAAGLADLKPGSNRQTFKGLRASGFLEKMNKDEKFKEELKVFAQSSKVVILNFGGNEATSDQWTKDSVENQNKIIDQLLQLNPKMRIIVVARPRYPQGFTPREGITADMTKNLQQINDQKFSRWKNHPNVIVVSCDSMNEDGHLKQGYVTSQNDVHINAKGRREMWRLIEEQGAIRFLEHSNT